jgi:hypothetical protein
MAGWAVIMFRGKMAPGMELSEDRSWACRRAVLKGKGHHSGKRAVQDWSPERA